MQIVFHNDWSHLLERELKQPYFVRLLADLSLEYQEQIVYPRQQNIFNALHYTSYAQTKVVILGQDPYHGPGQAHGLSFSVESGVAVPPSLRNIYKELKSDLGLEIALHGNLEAWAKQGVLLLNTVLTVRAGQPNSHSRLGWQQLTDRIISLLNDRSQPVVFILWGRHAQSKASGIKAEHHCVLSSAHPSPLSARHGFFGSKPFSKANEFLLSRGIDPIDWRLP